MENYNVIQNEYTEYHNFLKSYFQILDSKKIQNTKSLTIREYYFLFKYALENGDSKLFLELSSLSIQKTAHDHNNYYLSNILSIYFHYYFSHGNEKGVSDIIKMDPSLLSLCSHERHKIKYDVLKWWNRFRYHFENNTSCQEMNVEYDKIMDRLYALLDEHRTMKKDAKNAYQMLRDHIFYFKMGLFRSSIQVMTYKCIKWFKQCGLSKEYMKKLSHRMKYIQQEYETHKKVFLGIHWDDQNEPENHVLYFYPKMDI
jgi:hypothetical protein